MRRLSLVAAFAFLPGTLAAGPAPHAGVMIVASVSESAQEIMPPSLWRKIVAEYAGGRTVRFVEGAEFPDDTCRSAQTSYAVLARFERAMRLPGLAQDPDRWYGVGRFTVRNCTTGAVSATKTVRFESDPVAPGARVDAVASAERAWQQPVRTALAHDPLPLGGVAPPALAVHPSRPAVNGAPEASPSPLVAVAAPAHAAFRARVLRVDGDAVVLDSGNRLSLNQLLRVVADAKGQPYAVPLELIVVDISGKFAQASIVGKGAPRVGDTVEPAER